MSHEDKLAELTELKRQSALGGGQDRIDAQHQRDKLTARERIDLLVDPGSFEELDALGLDWGTNGEGDQFYGDAVVTGWGQIDGRYVCVFSQDFTVHGGSLSTVVGEKMAKAMDLAIKTGVPMIGLNDSGGARIQEGVSSLAGYGDIFYRNVRGSGVIPQISVIMGPAAGGAVYSPAITDFVFMVEGSSQMYITGPDVIQSVTGEQTSFEELGGAMSHASKSGVAQFAYSEEQTCLEEVRRLLAYLPSNNVDNPPMLDQGDDPNRQLDDILSIVPDDDALPYDVRDLIERLLDNSDFMEVHEYFAQNIVVGFGRIAGHSVGIVANQPMFLGGVLDIDSSRKAARFVRVCDAFNVPIITLVDVPGYLPGVSQEYGGIISHGAKLLYAYAEASVPKITIITRKAFGGAYVAMGSKHLGADMNLVWPGGAIAVMGGHQAVNIINRRDIQNAEDEESTRAQLIADYQTNYEHPYIAAAKGYVDDVIDPRETRARISRALNMLVNKSESPIAKKHGNIPL